MKIFLILLVASATTMIISKSKAERKLIEEQHPPKSSLQVEQQKREDKNHPFPHQKVGVDLGRIKVDQGGINGRYLYADDDDHNDSGADSPRGSSTDTHRQITYEIIRKAMHDIPKPAP